MPSKAIANWGKDGLGSSGSKGKGLRLSGGLTATGTGSREAETVGEVAS
jgi:hypothetical protein